MFEVFSHSFPVSELTNSSRELTTRCWLSLELVHNSLIVLSTAEENLKSIQSRLRYFCMKSLSCRLDLSLNEFASTTVFVSRNFKWANLLVVWKNGSELNRRNIETFATLYPRVVWTLPFKGWWRTSHNNYQLGKGRWNDARKTEWWVKKRFRV